MTWLLEINGRITSHGNGPMDSLKMPIFHHKFCHSMLWFTISIAKFGDKFGKKIAKHFFPDNTMHFFTQPPKISRKTYGVYKESFLWAKSSKAINDSFEQVRQQKWRVFTALSFGWVGLYSCSTKCPFCDPKQAKPSIALIRSGSKSDVCSLLWALGELDYIHGLQSVLSKTKTSKAINDSFDQVRQQKWRVFTAQTRHFAACVPQHNFDFIATMSFWGEPTLIACSEWGLKWYISRISGFACLDLSLLRLSFM